MSQEAHKIPTQDPVSPGGSRDSLPDWWTEDYEEAWKTRRDFLRGEWETLPGDQQKEDLTQSEPDTYRDWQSVEPAVRYGVGARHHYSQYDTWNAEVEDKLREDWEKKHDSQSAWARIKGAIRRGWESAIGRD